MKTILVTGFDPFGGEAINPAWEAVKELEGYMVNDYKVVTSNYVSRTSWWKTRYYGRKNCY